MGLDDPTTCVYHLNLINDTIMIHRFYNMHAMNTDAVSYQYKTPEKCPETAKHEKKSS